jgi:UDP:flavonoid glycosyltransferase YjiC (YdhE family)
MIYEAATLSGKRVLLSSGWAKLGLDVLNKPDSVFILGNCPHSWLFPLCCAVVHHGGAGTTAAGLRAALPTLVVCQPMIFPQVPLISLHMLYLE